jgi:hypothetical protein
MFAWVPWQELSDVSAALVGSGLVSARLGRDARTRGRIAANSLWCSIC